MKTWMKRKTKRKKGCKGIYPEPGVTTGSMVELEYGSCKMNHGPDWGYYVETQEEVTYGDD